eukprot:SAG11_NODE_2078_length_3855_cov_2.006124_3_plen_184_part_00
MVSATFVCRQRRAIPACLPACLRASFETTTHVMICTVPLTILRDFAFQAPFVPHGDGRSANVTSPLTLSLGIIAGADMTFLNGKLLGATPAAVGGHHPALGGHVLSTREYITPRSYTIPAGLLKPGGDNVLAVRVLSYGGAGLGAANASNYSDRASFPPYGTTFPGGPLAPHARARARICSPR